MPAENRKNAVSSPEESVPPEKRRHENGAAPDTVPHAAPDTAPHAVPYAASDKARRHFTE
jgi:hypothetical protein